MISICSLQKVKQRSVDQMTGGGRLSEWLEINGEAGQSGGVPRVDVSNDNDVNVSLLFTHFDILKRQPVDLEDRTAIVCIQNLPRMVE